MLDLDDPGKSGKLQPCLSYESWVAMGTGNVRQEQNVADNDCDSEIDITDGASGKKLGLNPKRKLAEWIVSSKVGIGTESKKDLYSIYKDNLDKGVYIADGTDVFEGRDVYLLKNPVYDLDYQQVYLDAETYMPLRELSYIEDVTIEPNPSDSTKNKVIKTGKMINNFGIRFIAGEIIDMENLPVGLFDLKIPEGYQIKDWVPFG